MITIEQLRQLQDELPEPRQAGEARQAAVPLEHEPEPLKPGKDFAERDAGREVIVLVAQRFANPKGGEYLRWVHHGHVAI